MAEAAVALGVSAATIRRMITAGLLPATQPALHAAQAKFVQDFVAASTKVMNLDRFDLA